MKKENNYVDKATIVEHINQKIKTAEEQFSTPDHIVTATGRGVIMGYKDVISMLDDLYENDTSDKLISISNSIERLKKTLYETLDIVNGKHDNDSPLDKFKSLQHISGDMKQTLSDWGYAPNLYFFDGMWHVSWISCSEGDAIKDFSGNTPEDAIDLAYDWFHGTFCNA